MVCSDLLKKKFSVGLCLNEPLPQLIDFFEQNKDWLHSVYFSLPLGMRYYSREALANEYDGNEEKLDTILAILSQMGIHREVALNTRNLSKDDLVRAIRYCESHSLTPEEIVCLREYGEMCASAFPEAEIKYSVNNAEGDGSGITEHFHTLVAGKSLLRDMNARHAFLKKDYGITLLLNNGCLPICNIACGASSCRRFFERVIDAQGLDRTYAACSFFPSELRTLLACDPCANRYRFKISNRPLGLDYTQQVLDAYVRLDDDYDALRADYKKEALFCTARPLARRMHEIDLERVRDLKQQWMTELQHDCHWNLRFAL